MPERWMPIDQYFRADEERQLADNSGESGFGDAETEHLAETAQLEEMMVNPEPQGADEGPESQPSAQP